MNLILNIFLKIISHSSLKNLLNLVSEVPGLLGLK